MTTLKPGTVFLHAKWLNNEKDGPLRCVVTRTTHNAIYWRPEAGGAVMYFLPSQESRYVKEVVS